MDHLCQLDRLFTAKFKTQILPGHDDYISPEKICPSPWTLPSSEVLVLLNTCQFPFLPIIASNEHPTS